MLEAIGVASLEDLFAPIPEAGRLGRPLKLPSGMSESELSDHLEALASRNRTPPEGMTFLGAGAYDHYAPSVVDAVLSRSEFLTSYTPYQPEVSQGTLQAIFEFQSLVCQLLGMEVANASLYDGGTALAEGVLMALRLGKRPRVLLSRGIHPEARGVVRTYLTERSAGLEEIPFGSAGTIDLEALDRALAPGGVASVAVQHPNVFGGLEPLDEIERRVHAAGATLVVACGDPIAFGLLKPPGAYGADIVTAEGQPLGLPLGFGGPYLGLFATRREFVRQMPGRIAGATTDAEGRRGFVLTLSTREQHIRREKATSNICTNEALCALGASVFLAALGKGGLRALAGVNHARAAYARRRLLEIPGVTARFEAPFFHEFVVRLPRDAERVAQEAAERGVAPGVPLGRWYPELGDALLVCVTERRTPEEIDRLCQTLKTLVTPRRAA